MSGEVFHRPKRSLPVDWNHGEGSRGNAPDATGESLIVTPGDRELAAIQLEGKVCGGCKYFELDHGQKLMKDQRFLERLVHEEEWQVRHLCSPVNQLGVCGAHLGGSRSDDGMITGTLHKGCDQWRPENGRVR